MLASQGPGVSLQDFYLQTKPFLRSFGGIPSKLQHPPTVVCFSEVHMLGNESPH